jgi:hypothetical protein
MRRTLYLALPQLLHRTHAEAEQVVPTGPTQMAITADGRMAYDLRVACRTCRRPPAAGGLLAPRPRPPAAAAPRLPPVLPLLLLRPRPAPPLPPRLANDSQILAVPAAGARARGGGDGRAGRLAAQRSRCARRLAAWAACVCVPGVYPDVPGG